MVRRIVVGMAAFSLVDALTWTGALVYAHRQGGSVAVGVVGFALLLPGVLVAPIASFSGDRYHRVRVLVVTYWMLAAGCAVTAIALASGAGPSIVYVAAGVTAMSVTFPRPAIGALVPAVVGAGHRLTAANVALGVAQSGAFAVGPAIAGLLLAAGGIVPVYACGAALAAVGAVVLTRVPLRQSRPACPMSPMGVRRIHSEVLAGIATVRTDPAPRIVVVVLGLGALMQGFLEVTVIVVAIDVLDRPESFAGWLGAALGVGAIVGAVLASVLVGRRRLAPAFLWATLVMGMAPLVLALGPGAFSTASVFALCGAGLALSEIAGQTLLQWVTPDEVMARTFGLWEGCQVGSIALGSLTCSLLFGALDTALAMLAMAAVIALVLAASARAVLRLDRSRPSTDPALLETLKSIDFLAPVPVRTLELVCASARRLEPSPGERLLPAGRSRGGVFVVARGTVHRIRDDRTIGQVGAGGHIGFQSLLAGGPVMTDLVAGQDAVVYELPVATVDEIIGRHPRVAALVSPATPGHRRSDADPSAWSA